MWAREHYINWATCGVDISCEPYIISTGSPIYVVFDFLLVFLLTSTLQTVECPLGDPLGFVNLNISGKMTVLYLRFAVASSIVSVLIYGVLEAC